MAQIGAVALLCATIVRVLMARDFLPGCVEGLQHQPADIGIGKIGCDTDLVMVLTIGQELVGLLACNRVRRPGLPEEFKIDTLACRSGGSYCDRGLERCCSQ
ncbi:hypothetical protein ACFFJ4_20005 [Xanthomonas dyei]|uniref:Uncharacterized protein n=1 Tax=Xanthomonas dyei TaxID=743699 RepID=A0A2S7BX94_9XANT|nr:hypothetical protein [Xanthomonas dyei]PPU53943.1 hypothetical protein XdyCFBP7245_20715 [Xanthomonas dyei]